ncbi:MAG: CoB--CoM heterodisulfide reductase iron-sulfur subunit B family protein [Candidatus Hermodarchaeota archaeon]
MFNSFWGCNIPTNQPFVEKSARVVFKRLGTLLREIEEATCCPENDLTRRLDSETALLISSVNLALSEQYGINDMVTFCNGCYHSLSHANHVLKDENQLTKVNEKLKVLELNYEGNVRIFPIAEFLATRIGIDRIKNYITNPLSDIKVACHYGCRLQERNLPSLFDEVVRVTGAQIVQYGLEKMCCGTPALYTDEDWAIMERARNKLISVKLVGADIIAVSCPACFRQFENTQLLLKRNKEIYDLPIMHLTELVALSFGFDEKDIGLEEHRIKLQR